MSQTAFVQARKLYEKGRLKDAVPHFRRALQESPEDANVIYHTILTLVSMRDYAGCAKWLHELLPHIDATATEPWLMAGFYYNFGVANEASGEWAKAVECYERALEYEPDNHLAKIMLAGNAYRLGDPEKGRRLNAEILAVPKMEDEPKSSRAFLKLLHGDYLGGFRDYEYRWKLPQILSQAYIPPHAKRWHGEHLEHGKRILVVAEQGVGDVLMAARFVPRLLEMGLKPVLLVHGGLVRLMESSFPGCDVQGMGGKHPQAGWWIPMLSLPKVFGTTIEAIPPAQCITVPSDGIILPSSPFRVGYVQKGNSLHMGDKDRSCHDDAAWEILLGLATHRQIDFLSLDEKHLKQMYGIRDFADTASIIQQCDLVVSIDSALAHCAGSLGKPVYLLPPAAPEWRWLLDRDDSPWYPTHKLFRRKHVTAWADVLTQVRQHIEAR